MAKERRYNFASLTPYLRLLKPRELNTTKQATNKYIFDAGVLKFYCHHNSVDKHGVSKIMLDEFNIAV